MRSIDVRVEPTVRLVHVVEGTGNTIACVLLLMFSGDLFYLPQDNFLFFAAGDKAYSV
jgi:hypothetical protein